MYGEDGVDWNHPWNDPRHAPSNWERPLEQPNPSVSPRDYADFYSYQEALASANYPGHYSGRQLGQPGATSPFGSPRPSLQPTVSRSRRAVSHAASLDFSDLVVYLIVIVIAISLVVSGIGWVVQKAYHSVFGDASTSAPVALPSTYPPRSGGTSQSAPSETPETSVQDPSAGPESVVQQYYADVNNQDFAAAWALGGSNLSSSQENLAAGYANTVHDDLTIDSVDGTTVEVDLVATVADGTLQHYVGSYEVQDGHIVAGHLRKR